MANNKGIFGIDEFISSIAIGTSRLCCDGDCFVSKEYVKSISRKIDLSAKPVFDYFFDINGVPTEHYPQYYCSPVWNECYNNYKWRYMVVNDGVCNYLVFLRIVGVMYHEQYVALSYDILSDNPQKANIQGIIELLKGMSCIKKAEIVTDWDDWDNVNFYNTETKKIKNRKARNIAAMEDAGVTMHVFYRVIPKDVDDKIRDLYKVFAESRFTFNEKRQRKSVDVALSTGMPVFVFMYKGKVIGIRVVSNDFGNSVYCHASKNISAFSSEEISKYLEESDIDICAVIHKYLGVLEEQKMNKYLLEEKHYDAVFSDGIIEKSTKGLFEHKREHYANMVRYKLIDINDYECK